MDYKANHVYRKEMATRIPGKDHFMVPTEDSRSVLKDRRKVPTFILNDRRSGVHDRRR